MSDDGDLDSTIREIMREVARATDKFPTWPTDPLHALAVLGEEFGELTKAVVQLTYEPHKTSAAEVRTEAIQTAAMALRFIASLGRYQYTPGNQHRQGDEHNNRATSGAALQMSAAECAYAIREMKERLDEKRR